MSLRAWSACTAYQDDTLVVPAKQDSEVFKLLRGLRQRRDREILCRSGGRGRGRSRSCDLPANLRRSGSSPGPRPMALNDAGYGKNGSRIVSWPVNTGQNEGFYTAG